MAFATFAINPTTPKNFLLYKKPHFTITLDTQHCKMSHIGLLKLHMLSKKYLGVQLQGKKMSQYSHYAVSKISQQVLRCSPASQSTRLFYKVYIDWLDLEDGWDNYQSDKAMVREVIMAICKTTEMPINYFQQSANKSENLCLIQNLVNWLTKYYNLHIKVIRLANKINQIKTTDWQNQNGIFFKPCVSDIHTQNSGAERFGQLIIKKV